MPISPGAIVASYCDGGSLLSVVIRGTLDADMLPVPEDFSVVVGGNVSAIRSLDVKAIGEDTVLALTLANADVIAPIANQAPGDTAGLDLAFRYHPTQWMMWSVEADDSIEAYEQILFPKMEAVPSAVASDHDEVLDEGAQVTIHAAEQGERAVVAQVCSAQGFRIQLRFDLELDTSQTPDINDFRAELDDRWLKVVAIKYWKPSEQSLPELRIEVSEQMPIGRQLNVAYKSPQHSLKLHDGAGVAPFQLNAVVGTSSNLASAANAVAAVSEHADNLNADIPDTNASAAEQEVLEASVQPTDMVFTLAPDNVVDRSHGSMNDDTVEDSLDAKAEGSSDATAESSSATAESSSGATAEGSLDDAVEDAVGEVFEDSLDGVVEDSLGDAVEDIPVLLDSQVLPEPIDIEPEESWTEADEPLGSLHEAIDDADLAEFDALSSTQEQETIVDHDMADIAIDADAYDVASLKQVDPLPADDNQVAIQDSPDAERVTVEDLFSEDVAAEELSLNEEQAYLEGVEETSWLPTADDENVSDIDQRTVDASEVGGEAVEDEHSSVDSDIAQPLTDEFLASNSVDEAADLDADSEAEVPSASSSRQAVVKKLLAGRSEVPATQSTSTTAKVILFIPIALLGWLVFIVVVYVSTLVFDIDLSLPSFSQDVAPVKVEKFVPVVPREPCSLKSSDGSAYEGECRGGERDGHGTYTWASGNRYEGQWSNGVQDGKGKLSYQSGVVYTGEFKQGLESGTGVMVWPNGARYEGSFSDGKFHGQGAYTSANGDRFEGEFSQGGTTKNGACYPAAGGTYPGPCQPRAAGSS